MKSKVTLNFHAAAIGVVRIPAAHERRLTVPVREEARFSPSSR